MKKILTLTCAILLGALTILAAGCTDGTSDTESSSAAAEAVLSEDGRLLYELTITGTAESAGLVSFLDYAINVYKDEASNSCGDCEDQPPHLYVGATAEEAVEQIIEAVERADNIWEVESVDGTTVTLIEKEAGTVSEDEIGAVEVPEGMYMIDSYGNESDGSVMSAAASEKTIYDLDGDPISVPIDPERLAAVYGPSYEALVVLGQEDRIVVRADVQTENLPWAEVVFERITEIPALENVHSSVNVEELLTYKPDLVLAFSRPNELKQLAAADVSAVPGTTTQTLSEIPELLTVYSHAIGNGSLEKADAYTAYFNEKLAYVLEKTEGLTDDERPSVYYCGIDLLTTYGCYSDIPELIETAGGTAVTADVKAGNHTQINFEQLASWNPDYIFIDHGGIDDGETVEELKEQAIGDAAYSAITAVKNDQICLSPTGVFYWDMGLQKILLLMYMAQILHPDLFEDLDMVYEIQYFYEKFYGYDLTKEEAQMILDREDP